MPFKIIRNDITKMNTDAIVNTANPEPIIGCGCDIAIYKAAGEAQLFKYRKENIGEVSEGDVFLTPGFDLPAGHIIHAVSPLFIDGNSGEEEKLRRCYSLSLQTAADNAFKSVAFPLISTGSFGYPKEEGMRIAIDEISAFLMHHEMMIYLVVFDEGSTDLGSRFATDLEQYIDDNYVKDRAEAEYIGILPGVTEEELGIRGSAVFGHHKSRTPSGLRDESFNAESVSCVRSFREESVPCEDYYEFNEELETGLSERLNHLTDTFTEYLLYLIDRKGMTNADVYKRAIVDKKVFSKIKNNPDYHPQKITALCLCVGAKLNIDETKDLLARAGYALSPCDKIDVIFSYFIEKEIYDMIELDICLEEHGLKCIIE